MSERRAADGAKERYLQVWEGVFGAFRGWDRSKVMAWARGCGLLGELDNLGSLVYHEPPQYWVVRELISRDRLSDYAFARLARQATEVFWDPATRFQVSQDVDWEVYRSQLGSIIGDHWKMSAET